MVTAMAAYLKAVTFDCADPLALAQFWAAVLGSDVDEHATRDRAGGQRVLRRASWSATMSHR